MAEGDASAFGHAPPGVCVGGVSPGGEDAGRAPGGVRVRRSDESLLALENGAVRAREGKVDVHERNLEREEEPRVDLEFAVEFAGVERELVEARDAHLERVVHVAASDGEGSRDVVGAVRVDVRGHHRLDVIYVRRGDADVDVEGGVHPQRR